MLDEVRRRSVRKAAVTALFLALVVSLAGIRDAAAAPPSRRSRTPWCCITGGGLPRRWPRSTHSPPSSRRSTRVFTEKRTVAPDRGRLALRHPREPHARRQAAGRDRDADGIRDVALRQRGAAGPRRRAVGRRGPREGRPAHAPGDAQVRRTLLLGPDRRSAHQPHLVQQARSRQARHRPRHPDDVGTVLRRGGPSARGRHGDADPDRRELDGRRDLREHHGRPGPRRLRGLGQREDPDAHRSPGSSRPWAS